MTAHDDSVHDNRYVRAAPQYSHGKCRHLHHHHFHHRAYPALLWAAAAAHALGLCNKRRAFVQGAAAASRRRGRSLVASVRSPPGWCCCRAAAVAEADASLYPGHPRHLLNHDTRRASALCSHPWVANALTGSIMRVQHCNTPR